MFLSNKKYFKFFTDTSKIFTWKSIGYAEENIENMTTSDSSFAPALINCYPLPDIKFNGNCLINNNNNIIASGMINIYYSYTLDQWSQDLHTDFTLGNWLFGSVNLTKKADPDKCKYSGYDRGFDSRSQLSFTHGSMGENDIIFIVDMSSSVHVDNNGKDILILGEEPIHKDQRILN